MLARDAVLQAMERMPEQVTYEQIINAIDELQFAEDVKRGLEDVAKGRTYAADDVFRELGLS